MRKANSVISSLKRPGNSAGTASQMENDIEQAAQKGRSLFQKQQADRNRGPHRAFQQVMVFGSSKTPFLRVLGRMDSIAGHLSKLNVKEISGADETLSYSILRLY
jgi:hypothetical protein